MEVSGFQKDPIISLMVINPYITLFYTMDYNRLPLEVVEVESSERKSTCGLCIVGVL